MIKLNQSAKTLELKDLKIRNDIVFDYFDNKVAKADYEDTLVRAIYIGVLAMMEDRFSAFLAKTKNLLGTELENLKMIFDMNQTLFYTSSSKGAAAELDIADHLKTYFDAKKIKDDVELTGEAAGDIPGNKTGDILIHLDDADGKKIGIECKFDKSVRLGDIADKDVYTRKTDTAWSQLIETNANRGSEVAIIVFDRGVVHDSILNFTEHVAYIPGVGFICIIDSQAGDYTNLQIAYHLSHDIVVNTASQEYDVHTLSQIVKRLLKTISEYMSIKKMVDSNIKNNQKILATLDKSLLLMEFNQEYLERFLAKGCLTDADMLEFYQGEEVSTRYKGLALG